MKALIRCFEGTNKVASIYTGTEVKETEGFELIEHANPASLNGYLKQEDGTFTKDPVDIAKELANKALKNKKEAYKTIKI